MLSSRASRCKCQAAGGIHALWQAMQEPDSLFPTACSESAAQPQTHSKVLQYGPWPMASTGHAIQGTKTRQEKTRDYMCSSQPG